MGVGYAHQRGIVHRDLKPANVLLDGANVPRVTDFGIACTLKGAHAIEEGFQGTPRYMAPEYVEQQLVSPQLDVYAVGVMLYEMLTGAPHVRDHGARPPHARHRAQGAPAAVRAQLRKWTGGSTRSCCARSPRTATSAIPTPPRWRRPSRASSIPSRSRSTGAPEGKAGTVEFLLRRMRYKSDFPALSETIRTVNKTVESDSERVSVLCNGILRDPALTSKLIKLVNSPAYARCGGTVSTISRAVAILGYDGVRGAALSLMLLEHLGNKAQAAALRGEIVGRVLQRHRGARAGRRGRACATSRRPPSAPCFTAWGACWRCSTCPRKRPRSGCASQSRGQSEAAAATEVLGVTYAELGIAVARYWNFPDCIVDSMKPGCRSRLPRSPRRNRSGSGCSPPSRPS